MVNNGNAGGGFACKCFISRQSDGRLDDASTRPRHMAKKVKPQRFSSFDGGRLNEVSAKTKPALKSEVFTPYTRIPPIGKPGMLNYNSDSDLTKPKKRKRKKPHTTDAAKEISKSVMSLDEDRTRFLRRKTYIVLDPVVCKKPPSNDPKRADFENSQVFGQKLPKNAEADEKDGIKTLNKLFNSLNLSRRKELILLSNTRGENQWNF